jgi:hypothetical protein
MLFEIAFVVAPSSLLKIYNRRVSSDAVKPSANTNLTACLCNASG